MDQKADVRTGTKSVAYFSMEVGLRTDLPTYSGGLGVLAGDTIRAAADLELPYFAFSLVHRSGYFRQTLDPNGMQGEEPAAWDPAAELKEVPERVEVEVEGRSVTVRAWEYPVRGVTGHQVPVYLLDTDLPENQEEDRRITDALYGGDSRTRILQEAVLGLGGAGLLKALGLDGDITLHLNEGHSAFLALALLEDEMVSAGTGSTPTETDVENAAAQVRRRCVFTTHTPVPAGHDRFPTELVESVLGPQRTALLEAAGLVEAREAGDDEEEEGNGGQVNMTHVALHFARFTNGVAARHGQVSREMFPGRRIHAITNGVHAATWTGEGFQALFDEHLPRWREDPYLLRQAMTIPLEAFPPAHARSKKALLDVVKRRAGVRLSPERFTIAFARRATPYKRADLLMSDLERLAKVGQAAGGLQILYSGKAHPRDLTGKEMIQRVVQAGEALPPEITLVYLEDYDMELGHHLAAGSDLWLNNPRKPMEASGTSGMKAALNGVPCLSVLDGWWIEGHVEGVTGWSIDRDWREPADPEEEATRLLDKLEETILPLYNDDPDGWAAVMRAAVAFNGSYFHTRRMMEEYLALAYRGEG